MVGTRHSRNCKLTGCKAGTHSHHLPAYVKERFSLFQARIGDPPCQRELCLAGKKHLTIQGFDLLVPCYEYVGLKRTGVKLGKGNCLKEGDLQAQNPHAEANSGITVLIGRSLCGDLGKQPSPEEGKLWFGLCPRLDPITPDWVRAVEQTLES